MYSLYLKWINWMKSNFISRKTVYMAFKGIIELLATWQLCFAGASSGSRCTGSRKCEGCCRSLWTGVWFTWHCNQQCRRKLYIPHWATVPQCLENSGGHCPERNSHCDLGAREKAHQSKPRYNVASSIFGDFVFQLIWNLMFIHWSAISNINILYRYDHWS